MERDTVEPRVDSLPGPQASEWVEYHHETAAPSTYVYEFVWDITEDAIGPFCTDPDGNVLMDFTSHVAASPLGYNNPKILDRAEELDMIDPLKIAGQDFYVSTGETPDETSIPGPAHLMDKLTDISSHYGFDTVFLSNSGAEAVENAMKICYDACETPKYGITFDGAFHGRTLGTLSVNRSKAIYRRKFPEIGGIQDVAFSEAGAERLRAKLDPDTGDIPPEEVAFLILEPIQGEGGYHIPSAEFLSAVDDVCKRHDIPIIADEIQSGLGRTGEMWAVDHFDIEPDVITSAKALRVGATISSSDVFPSETGRLSSTWGAGDLLGSMRGALTLAAIEDHDLLAHATKQGEYFLDRLVDVSDDWSFVVDARGLGLMTALEFDTKSRRDDVMETALQHGLLTLGCGEKTLRLLPPLDVTERELELCLEILESVFAEASPAVASA